MADIIMVQAGPNVTKDAVAFWENDPAHPAMDSEPNEHEVFVVAGRRPVSVAETPGVLAALSNGRLVRVGTDPAPTEQEREEETARQEKARQEEQQRTSGGRSNR